MNSLQEGEKIISSYNDLSNRNIVKRIKLTIWIYFLLLIFEGALRKWFLPFLATPLLVIRTPIAMYGVYLGVKYGVFSMSKTLFAFTSIGIIAIILALLVGHHNLIVALFGARIFLFHIPFIYLMRNILTYEDIIKIGRVSLMLIIIMGIIVFLQFYSAPTAWINRGVGGEGTAGFSGAMGFSRPSGTFSFTNGTASFFSFGVVYVAYFWLTKIDVNRLVLIGASISVLIAIPLSISRAYFFNVILLLFFVFFIQFKNSKFLFNIILIALLISILSFALIQIPSISVAMEAFTKRLTMANAAEGGVEGVLLDRFLGGMLSSFSKSANVPFWGYGIGMGSNVGAILISGSTGFLLPEGEWGRIIGEIGMLFGLTVVFLRVYIGVSCFISSFKLARKNFILPFLLISTGFVVIIQGQLGQPTSLGFFVLITGLILASIKQGKERG